jgi:hypothetical protein
LAFHISDGVGIENGKTLVELGLHLKLPLTNQVGRNDYQDPSGTTPGPKFLEGHSGFNGLAQSYLVAQQETVRIIGNNLVHHRNLVGFDVNPNLTQGNEFIVKMQTSIPPGSFLETILLEGADVVLLEPLYRVIDRNRAQVGLGDVYVTTTAVSYETLPSRWR